MNRRPALRAVAVAAAATCLAATTAASAGTPAVPLSDRDISRLRGEVQASLDAVLRTGVPGVEAFVRQGHVTIWAAAGTADLGTGRAATATDRVRVGSVTKSFVAAVVLQLVAEHRLALDTPVTRWLTTPLPNAERITVRMLLQHTSGLFDYARDPRTWAPYQDDPGYVWSPEALLALAAEHPPLFPPGTGWAYSNPNYVLLGRLVQTVTRHTLYHELTVRVLRPLGLTGTYFPQTTTVLRGRHAHGYTTDATGRPLDVTGWSTSWAWAAGSLVSTPADVARFQRALLAGQIVPPRLLRQMLHTLPTPTGFSYGLGVLTTSLPCADAVGHDGSVPGYWTTALTSPDRTRQVTQPRPAQASRVGRELPLVPAGSARAGRVGPAAGGECRAADGAGCPQALSGPLGLIPRSG